MKTARNGFLIRWFIACLVLLFVAPSAAAQEKKLVRVVFVSLSWNSEIPVRVALVRGFFKAQGLQIEPIFIRGGPAAIAALVSGEVDFASIGGAQAVMRGKARGLDVSIVGSISNQTNYVLLGNKQTRTLESLKGKIIGITGAGAFSEFAVRAFLKKQNIDPGKDVILRAVGNTTMRAAALEKGLVAAAPFSPEDAVRLMKSGYPLLSNFAESLDIPQSIIVTRGEVLEKYPETSKRFTSDLSIAVPGIQLMLDEDIRAGLVDSKFTVDKVIDDRTLKKAQDELRTEGRLKP